MIQRGLSVDIKPAIKLLRCTHWRLLINDVLHHDLTIDQADKKSIFTTFSKYNTHSPHRKQYNLVWLL